MEASIGQGGKYEFYTGNWFAARTINGGKTWLYVNPYSGYSDFCCDQVAFYDISRDMIGWLRMGVPNGSGVNTFKLGISNNGGLSFATWTISPTQINSGWTNQWWDYPHIQLSADYMYLTWNMFNSSGFFVRSVVLKINLDNLKAWGSFAGSYYHTTAWSTFVPVAGADHAMYFASNWPNSAPQNSRLGIWRWYDDSGGLTMWTKTITAWTFTNRGGMNCGAASGDWLDRGDQRVLAGARYSIMNANLKYPGRKVLGWWWNVAQGGSFPRPYIEAAAFYEDTMTQVPGNPGRPLMWSSGTCFAYPSVAPNTRQDIAIVMNYASSGDGYKPAVGFGLSDDYQNAPPGWSISTLAKSTARPSDEKWGDYNSIRPFYPSGKAWVAVAHRIWPSSVDCVSCTQPLFFAFGRERDRPSYFRWKKR
jgi:hypothetical protein